jgi:2,4-dienoyl-CoA reductase-like NADH-dependent reductase (Old Yellow Enzyme family)
MQADGIIRNGRADIILMAREMLRSPYWSFGAADILHQKKIPPVQYARAID